MPKYEVDLTTQQEETIKKQMEEGTIQRIKEQKTIKYCLYRGLSNLIVIAVLIGIVALFSYMLNTNLDGYYNLDNFDSCWIEEDIDGINKETGEKATKSIHFDCSDFEENKEEQGLTDKYREQMCLDGMCFND